jgi:integrase
MKGHLKERSPGHWAIVIGSRDPQTGKKKYKWHSFVGSRREAQAECARLVTEHRAGTVNLGPKKTTLADYLTDKWLPSIITQVSPASHERYSGTLRTNVIPALGKMPLVDIRPDMIAKAYGDMAGKLSPRSILLAHKVLKQALEQAVEWNLLGRNPCKGKKLTPKVERKEMAALDTDKTVKLIEQARGTPLFVPILLGSLCGLRRGEIAALRWRSVDLKAGTLSVVANMEQTRTGTREKSPKNNKGRHVPMPSILVEELRRYRLAESERLLGHGIRLTDDHHIALRGASPWTPLQLTHAFRTFAQQRRIAMRFHDLRHTHATQLLTSGVHPKVAQERLGHSSITTTIDLYSHVLPGMQEEAVGRVDQAMREAFKRQK